MATTTERLTARQRARARVEASKADQIAREQRQITAVATYFDEADKLARLIERGEIKHRTAQRDALAVLVDTDGMSAAAIAKLIGIKSSEVKAILEFESPAADQGSPDASSEHGPQATATPAAPTSGGEAAAEAS